MTSLSQKIQAAVLASALLMPAGAAMANDWSKTESRTRGTVIGAVAGAIVGGKKGAIVGAAVGNGVQYARHKSHPKRTRYVATKHVRHHHRTTTR